RVPKPFGHSADVSSAAVQQHQVEVAVGTELTAAQAADGDEADILLVAQQLDEPRLDELSMGTAEGAAGERAVCEQLPPPAGQIDGDVRRRRGPSRRCGSE